MITDKQEIDEVLGVEHIFSHGIYAKKMTIPKGLVFGSHKHNFTHISILAKGIASVEVNGEIKTYQAGDCIEIEAEKEHKITSIEDVVWYCIHATDETDVANIDETLINE